MSRRYLKFALFCVTASAGVFLGAEMLGMQVELYWVALPVVCIPPVMVLIRKFPAAFIPPVIFMGSLKNQSAASNLDLHDPTLWTLGLLLATTLVHALFALAGIDRLSLGSLLRGQRDGIVTYLLFLGVLAFSYQYSLAPDYGFKELTHFMAVGSLLFFSSLVLVRSETDFRHLIAVTLVLALVITVRRFFGIMNYSEIGPVLRPDGTVEDLTKIAVAELSGMAMLLVLLSPKSMRVRVPRWLLLLCVVCLATGLTISIARGPLISFMGVLLASLLTSKSDVGLISRKAMVFGIVLLLVPSILLSLLWVGSTAQEKVGNKTSELTKLVEFSDPGGSAGMRLKYYQRALGGFAERPLAGWGLGSFSVYVTGQDTREYPHNLVLQVAMEQGLLGLAALAAFSMVLVQALRKTVFVTRGQWAFILWMVAYHFCVAMFSGDLDDQRPLVLWCGLAFAGWRILRLRVEGSPPDRTGIRQGVFSPGYAPLPTR